LIGQGSRHPDQVASLANPGLEKITVVIVLRHPDCIPADDHLVSLANGSNVSRGTIEGVCNWQPDSLHDYRVRITAHIHHERGNPAPLAHSVHIHIQPSSDRSPTVDCARIACSQVPRPQVSLGWTPKAGSQRFVHRDFGKIECR
jgi:hypothetical protein